MKPTLTGCMALCSLVAASCASLEASLESLESTTTPYVTAPHFAPAERDAVKIVRTEPLEPHERLGEIVVDMSITWPPPIAKVEARLAEESAKLGANAVVVVVDRVQPSEGYVTGTYWGRPMESVTGRKTIGVAIKYK
jgi:hypothetical protein